MGCGGSREVAGVDASQNDDQFSEISQDNENENKIKNIPEINKEEEVHISGILISILPLIFLNLRRLQKELLKNPVLMKRRLFSCVRL